MFRCHKFFVVLVEVLTSFLVVVIGYPHSKILTDRLPDLCRYVSVSDSKKFRINYSKGETFSSHSSWLPSPSDLILRTVMHDLYVSSVLWDRQA